MPARTERNALQAGLFICVTVLLVIGVVIGIKGVAGFVAPAQHRLVRFKMSDDVGGLGVGDDVRIGGAKVGVVRKITINPGDGTDQANAFIDVAITMPNDYMLRNGTMVTVQSTLTGLSVLNFSSLGHGDLLKADDVIHGAPSGLTSFLASAGELGPSLAQIASDVKGTTIPKVNNLIAHVDAKIDPIVAQYNLIAGKGTDTLNAVTSLLGDTHSDVRATIASINAIAARVRDKLPALLDRLQSVLDQVNTAVAKANDSMGDLHATVSNAKDITGSARELLIGNRGKIEEMIASLRTTSENLKGASAEIRRSPWRLLYHPSSGEMANLNLYDSARQFAEGANNLSDAATALRDEIKAQPANKEKLEDLSKKLDASFAHFNDVEQELWSRVKE